MSRPKRSRVLRKTRLEVMEERLAFTVEPWGATQPDSFRLEAHSELLESAGEYSLVQHAESASPACDASQEHHVTSISPIADFRFENEFQTVANVSEGDVTTQLNDVHGMSGVDYVRTNFGFTGTGQTVAIIDSGIAYDHYALGRGFGSGYRVVGGWDFAENDANPYDDGPSGFHGTHVAGIVGSSNTTNRGVASGVDLVALRVFDDNGNGYFSWVESALQWVHQHRNDNRFPITTVNLSIGTNWNADTVPGWANLEEEFAQLRADGILVSVSAGNSFTTYNAPGLSYPAASPYVVPVASVDNNGSMSSFSQRNSRVIAAPGRSITSTVPDYLYGTDGIPNDFGTASGTSMAAPYLAGAAALVRQAMTFVGITNITQDTIYNHIRNTADQFFDSATNATYRRLNLQTALNVLMPNDDYGNHSGSAHSLGTLNGSSTLSGVVGSLTDVDYFTFTAGQSGSASVVFTPTHELAVNAQFVGGTSTFANNTLRFNVVAGQTYSVSLGTSSGIGRYSALLQMPANAPTAPSSFQAIATSPSEVRLSWGDSSGETDYWVYQWINGVSTYIDGIAANSTSYTVRNLTPGSTNHFYVVAHNAAGITGSGWQQVTTASVAPTAPGNFAATATSATQVRLSWSDSSGETEYWVYQWINGLSTFIDRAAANSTNYTVSNLAPGSTNHFYLVAHNTSGNTGSGWQAVTTAALAMIPTAPGNFAATATSATQVRLSWSDSTGEADYWVYQYINGVSTYLETVSANTTSHMVNNLTPGSLNHFYLVAHNASGITGSGWQSATTTPTAAANFAVSATSSTEALLTWSDSSGESDYWIYQWIGGMSTYQGTVAANSTSFRAENLAPGETHHFYVVAHNSFGTTGSGWRQITMPNASPAHTAAEGIPDANLLHDTRIAAIFANNERPGNAYASNGQQPLSESSDLRLQASSAKRMTDDSRATQSYFHHLGQDSTAAHTPQATAREEMRPVRTDQDEDDREKLAAEWYFKSLASSSDE